MEVRICRVSFTTTSGIRHSAEIQADSLYEAAVEGIKAISQQCGASSPGPSRIREAVHYCSVPVRLHIARDGEEALLMLMELTFNWI